METKNNVAWRDGHYIYCLSHSSEQVTNPEMVADNEPDLYDGRKCDWCRKPIQKGDK